MLRALVPACRDERDVPSNLHAVHILGGLSGAVAVAALGAGAAYDQMLHTMSWVGTLRRER